MINAATVTRRREDPLDVIASMRSRWHNFWLRKTYSFAAFGERVSVDSSCDIARSFAPEISVGDDVYLAPDVWINIVPGAGSQHPKIVIGRGCKVGRQTTISAHSRIVLGADVLIAPGVSITDLPEMPEDPTLPSLSNRIGRGGVVIERNCWLGFRAEIRCIGEEITIGRNSVVGANAVVTRSFPPFSVIGGNPARLIKQYDQETGKWLKPND